MKDIEKIVMVTLNSRCKDRMIEERTWPKLNEEVCEEMAGVIRVWEERYPEIVGIDLYCDGCKLTELPENLPSGMTGLYCDNNRLIKLPENLPSGLRVLYCYINHLETLPENLPSGLSVLSCSNNRLKALPENLPSGLTELNCSYNQLTTLPSSIGRCRRLKHLSYINNPIDSVNHTQLK